MNVNLFHFISLTFMSELWLIFLVNLNEHEWTWLIFLVNLILSLFEFTQVSKIYTNSGPCDKNTKVQFKKIQFSYLAPNILMQMNSYVNLVHFSSLTCSRKISDFIIIVIFLTNVSFSSKSESGPHFRSLLSATIFKRF